LPAGDTGARRWFRGRPAAAAPAAAVALSEGLTGRLSRPRNARDVTFDAWLKQPVQVDDHIFHLGVVDRALGLAAPGVLGRGEAVVDPHQIDRAEVEL